MPGQRPGIFMLFEKRIVINKNIVKIILKLRQNQFPLSHLCEV